MKWLDRLLGIKRPSINTKGFNFESVNNLRVIDEYPELWSTAPLHFTDKHFRAITIDQRKFLYCPVENICSWSVGDYDHQYCHACGKFFEELQK